MIGTYSRRAYGVRKNKRRPILIFDSFEELVSIVFDNTQAATFIGLRTTGSICNAIRTKSPVLGRFMLRLYDPALNIPLDEIHKLRLYEYDQLVADFTSKNQKENGQSNCQSNQQK